MVTCIGNKHPSATFFKTNATSYEAQQNYYTDKIMTNREWTMAGIFADEGITGTSARKRPEFLKMIRLCKQKKIDIVLTKSISRFARNTVDCLNYIRALRELGIAVIFEKENINTLEADSEILITMLGAFAQAESESISANVRWGKRQAMREGKTIIQYSILGTFTPKDVTGSCVYCNHCAPCPAGLNIGLINKYYDLAVIGDGMAADHYTKLEKHASDCIRCGHCDGRCPFHVVQTERMQAISRYFGQ